MRLAAGGESLPLLPQRISMQLFADLGFEGYDLILRGGNSLGVKLEDVRADIPGWAGRFDERVGGAGLELADIFCVPGNALQTLAVNHPDAGEREQSWELFDDVLDLAVRLQAPGMTLLPGIDWDGEGHEQSLDRAADELQRRAEAAVARGIRLSIEPHIGSVCSTPKEALELCQRAPALELALNYTHFTVQGFSDDDIEPLLKHARHYKARGARPGRLQCPLKENTIDFERVVDAMQTHDYDGYIAMDYVWIDTAGLNDIDVISETLLLRDRLRAKFENQPWQYPQLADMDFGAPAADD